MEDGLELEADSGDDSDEPTAALQTHPLLAPLTAAQSAVVEVLAQVWGSRGRWPIRRYVEHEMERRGYPLEEVLPTFPAIRESTPGSRLEYRAVRFDAGSYAPDEVIRLTMAGFAHLPTENQPPLRYFLRALDAVARSSLAREIDPFEVDEQPFSFAQVVGELGTDGSGLVQRMAEFFAHEPATWGGRVGGDEADPQWRYTRAMRHFVGVTDVDDYLARLSSYLSPPVEQSRSVEVVSPLGLAASLDFLDTVWRLRYQRGLMILPGAVPVASLDLGAASADEFQSRLSALGQVLKGFQVERTPGVKNHPVPQLAAYLQRDLSQESSVRVLAAIKVLSAVVAVRNAAQHTHAAPETVEALRTLGVAYPVQAWDTSWQTIRTQVVLAIDAIREELLAETRTEGN
jgi:hypothetical protein